MKNRSRVRERRECVNTSTDKDQVMYYSDL